MRGDFLDTDNLAYCWVLGVGLFYLVRKGHFSRSHEKRFFTIKVLLESAIDFIRQANFEGMVPVRCLAGGYSP
jgi:hypothetical protein